jgi:hypothetical protein
MLGQLFDGWRRLGSFALHGKMNAKKMIIVQHF